MHTYKHTYIHTYIHTFILTYITLIGIIIRTQSRLIKAHGDRAHIDIVPMGMLFKIDEIKHN